KSIKPKLNLSIDVFITVFNESNEVVRKTVFAAVHMDYPHKTYVLDDGNNPSIKELAKSLGAYYLSRPDNQNAKAGNLNYGLALSTGDYIAVFDADHIPNKNFLMDTLGFFKNSKVAFVQTPQEFYNINSFQL
ncbi:MAG: glycosyltransferase, partial [Chitinophagia bacterium]|nr:glycosyltransferase [Chitinophagia bacterium]